MPLVVVDEMATRWLCWRCSRLQSDVHSFRRPIGVHLENPELVEALAEIVVDFIYSCIQDTEPRRLACSRNIELYLSEHVL